MHRIPKYLYVIGGCTLAAEREPIAHIERIRVADADGKEGVRIVAENCGQLAMARRAPACFLTENRRILVAGGCLEPNNHTDSIEILDFNKTTEKTEIRAEKLTIGASCSAFDPYSTSKFKPIFGGFEAHSCLDDVQILEESGDTWQCRALSGSPKGLPKLKNSCALEVGDGEFLLFGGWEDEARTSKTIRRVTFNADFTEFEVNFEGFLPYPVEGHSLVRHGASVFLIGGFDGCFVIDTIVRYDLETRKSEILELKLAEKRENHVSAVLGGRFLVVAGGWNSRTSLDDVEVFELLGEQKLERRHVAEGGNLKFARNRPTGIAI